MTYRRLATAGTFVPFAFGLLGLAAWMTGLLRLASLRTEFIPMAPSSAVAFVLVSATLMAVAFGHGTTIRNAVRAAAGLVSILAVIEVAEFFAGVTAINWEAALIGRPGMFGGVPLARMSPLTATTLTLVGLALGCSTSARSAAIRDLGGVLGSLVALVGSTVALGYAYGAPLLYGGPVIPMALTTGLAFMGTGVALVALAGSSSLPLRPFFRGARRAELAETERTRAEKATRDSERLNRSLVEHLPQRIFVKDRNSNYVFCNSNYARDLGIVPAQIVGKDDFAFFPQERADAYRADDRKVMADGKIADLEERYPRAGEERWSHTIKVPYRDEQGAIIGVVGIFEDITDRKRAEAELGHERDRAQRYLDTAEVILLALDTQGRITLANRHACSVLGWRADELLGRDWIGTCLPAGIRDEWKEKFHRLVGGDLPVGENPVLTRSGEERLIEWRNTLLRDDEGRVIGTLSSGTDITERRALEAQYQQAQKMEAVGQLAAGVAHDFNNMLTVILGFCDLLLGDLPPGGRASADVTEIKKTGERAGGLTRQLLAFSRKQVIEPTLLDLNVVVNGMLGMLARLIGKDVEVVLNLQPAVAFVKADQGQVEQVLMNLAVNARDAMPSGGTLTIETANVDLDESGAARRSVTAGPYVMLTVRDTGTGMTPSVRAHLFEPFFTTKAAGKGTGLGLATVRAIVVRSGASIEAESEVGRGTSFTMHFPTVVAEATTAAEPPPTLRRDGPPTVVLVVDDEAGLRELAKRLLERQGYTVRVAADAEEAVALFEQNPDIDLLLTDVVMPGTSGPELTRRLVTRWPGLRVIYMSGYTDDVIAPQGVLNPGIAFLHKPFTAETLARKIEEVLDRRLGLRGALVLN